MQPDHREGERERRTTVLESAVRLLAADGPAGLSVRRVAAAAGGSAQLVYTLFGGKDGLIDGVFAEGHARLGAALSSVDPPPGSRERIISIGQAYRAFAHREPGFFAVMFSDAIPGYRPPEEARRRARESTLGVVLGSVQACLDAGTLVLTEPGTDADDIAHLCWATVHGLVSLELAGHISPELADRRFLRASDVLARFTPAG
ncbi:MAG: WHG domain-containing protein [Nocardioides sp.]